MSTDHSNFTLLTNLSKVC